MVGSNVLIGIPDDLQSNKVKFRLALQSDGEKVRRMVGNGAVRYIRVPLKNFDSILSSRLVIVAAEGDELRACLISIWPYPPYAWLDALAAEQGPACDKIVDGLLDCFEHYLDLLGAHQVSCSFDDGDSNPVREILMAKGFSVTSRFLHYEKTNFSVPKFETDHTVVRSCTNQDLASVYRIEEASFEPEWRNNGAKLRQIIDRFPSFMVALIDGIVAGFQYSTVDGTGVGKFVHTAVAPRFRGLNVGKALLADAIDFFQRQRVKYIEVRTEKNRIAAQRLFTSFGFLPKGPHRDVLTKKLKLYWKRKLARD